MVNSSLSVQDLLTYGSKSNSKKVDLDAILPFIILPILFLIATISRTVTIIVMVVIVMGVLYVYSRPRHQNKSPFFYSWTLSSGISMFLMFETGIVRLLEITQLENFIFLLLLTCTCYFFYKMKAVADYELIIGPSKGKDYSPVLTADSHYCKICQIEVNEKLFHSIWWDCCVFRPNYKYYLAGQTCAFFTLLIGTNLGLTTVCQPFMFTENILLPEDCNNVYFEFDLAWMFVACVYGVGYLLVVAMILIHQAIVCLSKNAEPQWRRLVNVLNV